jgi:membrane protease YdiL (CAAX protease family)
MFFIAVSVGAKSGSGQLKDVLAGKGELDVLMIRLIAGIFFFGTGAAILFERRELGQEIIDLNLNYNYIVWTLIALTMITGISSALKKSNFNNSHHSLPYYAPLAFVFTRTLFMIMYEFFFRGVMLFIMIEDIGITAAIILNLVLYMLVHWFNKQERYGSVIMGVVLCGVTIYYHSVWPAIIIHLSLALSYEIGLLIKYKSSFKKTLI